MAIFKKRKILNKSTNNIRTPHADSTEQTDVVDQKVIIDPKLPREEVERALEKLGEPLIDNSCLLDHAEKQRAGPQRGIEIHINEDSEEKIKQDLKDQESRKSFWGTNFVTKSTTSQLCNTIRIAETLGPLNNLWEDELYRIPDNLKIKNNALENADKIGWMQGIEESAISEEDRLKNFERTAEARRKLLEEGISAAAMHTPKSAVAVGFRFERIDVPIPKEPTRPSDDALLSRFKQSYLD